MRFSDIIGQEEVVGRLRGFGEFYVSRGTAPGHILLTGEDAMGQSCIAAAFANQVGHLFQEIDATKLEITGDLSAILTNFNQSGNVLLLTNIHLLRKIHLDRLRKVLREAKLEIQIGQGGAARTHIFEVRPFTLMAACPKKSDCPAELLGEFALILTLRAYSRVALQAIAESIARKAGIGLEPGAAELIASACDGRPGGINSMLRRLLRAVNAAVITREIVLEAFAAFGISVSADSSMNDIVSFKELSGVEFEKLIAALLVRMGFQTEITKASGDGGIDIIATLEKSIFGGRYLFQCKRFAPDNLVGAPTLRDFYGAVTADRAVKGVFITTSDFTVQAKEFGQRVGMELIDFVGLQRLLLEYGLTNRQEP